VRVWNVSDDCGNYVIVNQTYTLLPPIQTFPLNVTLFCTDDYTNTTITGTPSSTAPFTATYSDGASTNYDCGTTSTLLSYVRTWNLTDQCGSVIYPQLIVVVPKAPMLNLPPDATVSCNNDTSTNALGDATAVASCPGFTTNTSYSDNTTLNGCEFRMTISRVWTATDSCGQVVSQTQIITVTDNFAPTFTVSPLSLSINCTKNSTSLITSLNVATLVASIHHPCDPNPQYNFTDSLASNCGSISRTWIVTDACGVSSQIVQKINQIAPPTTTSTAYSHYPVMAMVVCSLLMSCYSLFV